MTPLRQRMLEDMAIRNLAENTQSSYLQQIIAYAKHLSRAPEDLGPEEIRAYQLHLTQTRRLSASSVSVATGALRFLYKVILGKRAQEYIDRLPPYVRLLWHREMQNPIKNRHLLARRDCIDVVDFRRRSGRGQLSPA